MSNDGTERATKEPTLNNEVREMTVLWLRCLCFQKKTKAKQQTFFHVKPKPELPFSLHNQSTNSNPSPVAASPDPPQRRPPAPRRASETRSLLKLARGPGPRARRARRRRRWRRCSGREGRCGGRGGAWRAPTGALRCRLRARHCRRAPRIERGTCLYCAAVCSGQTTKHKRKGTKKQRSTEAKKQRS